MSIRVSVHGSPVRWRADSGGELQRRRRLRIQQVREQSKDIANAVRQRYREEQRRQKGLRVEEDRERRRRQEKEELEVLRRRYHQCLAEVGTGHSMAAAEPDAAMVLAASMVQWRSNAEERGHAAAREIRTQVEAAHRHREEEDKHRAFVRTIEDLRSSIVCSLPPKAARKSPSKARASRLVSKGECQQRGASGQPPPVTVTMDTQVPEFIPPLEGLASASLADCASSAGSSSGTKRTATAGMRSSESELLKAKRSWIQAKADEIRAVLRHRRYGPAAADSEDGCVEEVPLSDTVPLQRPHVRVESHGVSIHPHTSRNLPLDAEAGGHQADAPWAIAGTVSAAEDHSDAIRSSRPARCTVNSQRHTDAPLGYASTSAQWDAVGMEVPLIDLPRDATERLKSRSRSASTGRAEQRVQFYDYNNRYEREYFPTELVERVDKETEPDARHTAKQEAAEGVKAVKVVDRSSVRGQRALTKQRLHRDYQQMMDRLQELVQQERRVHAGCPSAVPADVYLNESRRQERRSGRQRHMDSAFERMYHSSRWVAASTERPTYVPMHVTVTESRAAAQTLWDAYDPQTPVKLNVGRWEATPAPQDGGLPDGSIVMGHSPVEAEFPRESLQGKEPLERLLKRIQLQRSTLLQGLKGNAKEVNVHDLSFSSSSSSSGRSVVSCPDIPVRHPTVLGARKVRLGRDGGVQIGYGVRSRSLETEVPVDDAPEGRRPIVCRTKKTRPRPDSGRSRLAEEEGKVPVDNTPEGRRPVSGGIKKAHPRPDSGRSQLVEEAEVSVQDLEGRHPVVCQPSKAHSQPKWEGGMPATDDGSSGTLEVDGEVPVEDTEDRRPVAGGQRKARPRRDSGRLRSPKGEREFPMEASVDHCALRALPVDNVLERARRLRGDRHDAGPATGITSGYSLDVSMSRTGRSVVSSTDDSMVSSSTVTTYEGVKIVVSIQEKAGGGGGAGGRRHHYCGKGRKKRRRLLKRTTDVGTSPMTAPSAAPPVCRRCMKSEGGAVDGERVAAGKGVRRDALEETSSTVYLSPPDRLSADAIDVDSLLKTLVDHHQGRASTTSSSSYPTNPQLLHYMGRLLAMSRDKVSALNVSCSDVSSFSADLVQRPSNIPPRPVEEEAGPPTTTPPTADVATPIAHTNLEHGKRSQDRAVSPIIVRTFPPSSDKSRQTRGEDSLASPSPPSGIPGVACKALRLHRCADAACEEGAAPEGRPDARSPPCPVFGLTYGGVCRDDVCHAASRDRVPDVPTPSSRGHADTQGYKTAPAGTCYEVEDPRGVGVHRLRHGVLTSNTTEDPQDVHRLRHGALNHTTEDPQGVHKLKHGVLTHTTDDPRDVHRLRHGVLTHTMDDSEDIHRRWHSVLTTTTDCAEDVDKVWHSVLIDTERDPEGVATPTFPPSAVALMSLEEYARYKFPYAAEGEAATGFDDLSRRCSDRIRDLARSIDDIRRRKHSILTAPSTVATPPEGLEQDTPGVDVATVSGRAKPPASLRNCAARAGVSDDIAHELSTIVEADSQPCGRDDGGTSVRTPQDAAVADDEDDVEDSGSFDIVAELMRRQVLKSPFGWMKERGENDDAGRRFQDPAICAGVGTPYTRTDVCSPAGTKSPPLGFELPTPDSESVTRPRGQEEVPPGVLREPSGCAATEEMMGVPASAAPDDLEVVYQRLRIVPPRSSAMEEVPGVLRESSSSSPTEETTTMVPGKQTSAPQDVDVELRRWRELRRRGGETDALRRPPAEHLTRLHDDILHIGSSASGSPPEDVQMAFRSLGISPRLSSAEEEVPPGVLREMCSSAPTEDTTTTGGPSKGTMSPPPEDLEAAFRRMGVSRPQSSAGEERDPGVLREREEQTTTTSVPRKQTALPPEDLEVAFRWLDLSRPRSSAEEEVRGVLRELLRRELSSCARTVGKESTGVPSKQIALPPVDLEVAHQRQSSAEEKEIPEVLRELSSCARTEGGEERTPSPVKPTAILPVDPEIAYRRQSSAEEEVPGVFRKLFPEEPPGSASPAEDVEVVFRRLGIDPVRSSTEEELPPPPGVLRELPACVRAEAQERMTASPSPEDLDARFRRLCVCRPPSSPEGEGERRRQLSPGVLREVSSRAATWSPPLEELEATLRRLGIGWAGAMLRKTQEAMAFSSSSSDCSPAPRPAKSCRQHGGGVPTPSKPPTSDDSRDSSFIADVRGHSTPLARTKLDAGGGCRCHTPPPTSSSRKRSQASPDRARLTIKPPDVTLALRSRHLLKGQTLSQGLP